MKKENRKMQKILNYKKTGSTLKWIAANKNASFNAHNRYFHVET